MTADQGQYEKFMAKLSKSGLELQKDFSRLSPENQRLKMEQEKLAQELERLTSLRNAWRKNRVEGEMR